ALCDPVNRKQRPGAAPKLVPTQKTASQLFPAPESLWELEKNFRVGLLTDAFPHPLPPDSKSGQPHVTQNSTGSGGSVNPDPKIVLA
ncbi:MAG TPA: hypothetical protein VFA04_10370, partial [Bryobacteraceae bacterium]|nr:hypothetical protein [Bryobacteraceae bacterium]